MRTSRTTEAYLSPADMGRLLAKHHRMLVAFRSALERRGLPAPWDLEAAIAAAELGARDYALLAGR